MLYYFTNSYFIAVVIVLFLIHYPLQKHFKEGYIFSVFLESQNFYGLSWATMDIAQKLKKSLMENFIFCAVEGILSVTNQNKQ